eukprot:jgi/Picsp_1/5007/NSC_02370-R1_protein
MGKVDRRKSASSAQAAEILSKTNGEHAASSVQSNVGLVGGFSFGSRYISQVANDEQREGQPSSSEHAIQAQGVASISPTWSRYFQHLSKADARTRQKALLSLREAVRSSPEEAVELLDLWSKQFPRLVMDQSKQVRIAACQMMTDVADAVGRQMASIIRSIFPFLFFCKFDPSQEVSQEAQKALSVMFPGDKYLDALHFCLKSVLKEITVIMQARPEVLGDPKKETSEEMEERYYRMLSQVLKGMHCLVETADGATKDGHSSTFLQGVKSVICTQAFRTSCLESINSNVRRDSYDLITAYSLSKSRAKDLEDVMHMSVFRCLKDAEPANVVSLFAMMIAYSRSFQSSWDCIEFENDFTAQLLRILSCSSYSNYIFDVYKSMLPLISVIPPSLLTDAFVSSMIEALWNTHGNLGHNPKLCYAARQALTECILLSDARMGTQLRAECSTKKSLLKIFRKSLDTSDLVSMQCTHSLFKELLTSLGGSKDAGCKHGSQSILMSEANKIISDRLRTDCSSSPVFRFIQALDNDLIALQISVLVGAFSGRDAAFWESADLSVMHQLQANIQSACAKSSLNLEQILDSGFSFHTPEPRVLSMYRTEFYPQLLSRLLSSKQPWEELPTLGCLSLTLVQGSPENGILVLEAFETLLENFRFDIAAAVLDILLGLQLPRGVFLSLQSDALDLIGDDFMSLVKSDIDYSCDKWNFKKLFVLGKDGRSLLSTKKAAKIFEDLVDCAVLMSDVNAKIFILGMADEVYRSHSDINHYISYTTLESHLAMLLGCLWDELLQTVDAQQDLNQIKRDLEDNGAILLITEILASPMFDDYLVSISSQDVSSLDKVLGHAIRCMESFLDKNFKEDGTDHWVVKFMLCYTLEAFHRNRSSLFAQAIESLISVFTRLPHLFLETIEDFGDASLQDVLSHNKGLIFVCDVLAKLIGQGINAKPIFTFLESNTCYVPLILGESWRMVETGTLNAEDFSKLLYKCMSSKTKGVQNYSAVFFCQLVDNSNVDLFCEEYFTLVDKVSALLRSDEELFKISNLGSFAYKTAEMLLRRENVSGVNKLIKSCYPVLENALSRRYWSPYQPGAQIWCYDAKSCIWNPGTILSVDNSLSPPAYTVKTNGGVRDTEPERLSLRQSGPFHVPHPDDSVHVDQGIRNYAIQDEELLQLKAAFSLLVDQFGDHNYEMVTLREAGCTLSSIASIFSIAWGELGINAKVAAIHQCSVALKVACKNLEEFVTTALPSSLNKIVKKTVGHELEDLSSMCNFFDKLHSNQALQKSEKVTGLYREVRSTLSSEFEKYCEANSDAVAGALKCYFVLSDLESMSRLTGMTLEWEKSEISMLTYIFKIFGLLGEVVRIVSSTPSHEDEDCKCLKKDMWHHVAKVVYFALKKADNKFLDMCATEYNKSSKLMSMSSSFIHLAFSSQLATIASQVALSGILLMPNFLDDLWKPNSVTFFRDMESNISSDMKSSLEASETAQQLEICGMHRQVAEMLCVPHHPNYNLACFLLIMYLNSRDVDSSARDLLLLALKERGSVVQSMLDGLSRAVQQAHRLAEGGSDSFAVIRSFKMLESEHIDRNLINAFLTMNDLDRGNFESRCTYIPEELIFLGAFVGLQVASRAWFLELGDRRIQGFAIDYVKTYVNSIIVSREFNDLKQNIDKQDAAWSKSFEIYPETHRDRITARLEVEDGHCLELNVSFPPDYPLKAPIVTLEKYVGISEAKARKWMLSITAFLMNRSGTITEVINLWKNNVAKEFEGQEDCLICYSIIQPSTGQLPKLSCKTCHQKFHGTCLYKWFRSSSKSNCPHCQSPW